MSTISDDSLLSLLAAVNDVSSSLKEDSNVRNVLKIVPIVENAPFEFGDLADCTVILDASMVSAAFKFYKNQMFSNTLSFERSGVYNDMWKNNYALSKAIDSPISLSISTEVEKSPLHVNETGNLLIADQIDELNNTSILNLNRIKSGHSMKDNNEVCSKSEDNHFQNNSEEIEKNDLMSVSKDSVYESSSTNFEERISINSINFYENNYLPDELDYEPSEMEDVNDNESYGESFLEVSEYESISDCFLEDENSKDNSLEMIVDDRDDNQSTDCANTEFLNSPSETDEKICGKGLKISCKRNIECVEDDTDTDNDHSFKRNSDKKTKREILTEFDAPEIPLNTLSSTKEIELHIREQCSLGNLNEAICTAKKFIPDRGKTAQVKIFRELFIALMKVITDLHNSLENGICLKAIEDTINICLDSKLYNPELCSLIIIKCFSCDISISNGKKMLIFCQKMNICLNSKAIASCVDFIEQNKISLPETISFLEYVKNICKTSSPKNLLHEIVDHFSRGEERNLCPEFYKLCKFLCSIETWDIDRDYLLTFIKCCIKNDCWTQVADFFLAWVNKSCLLECLIEAFTFQFENVGFFYEKFAQELFSKY